MAEPCDCQQCRVRRALFGNTTPTNDERDDGVWSLVFVLGFQLARYNDVAVAHILQRIADVRAQHRPTPEVAASRIDLSTMEVGGHG